MPALGEGAGSSVLAPAPKRGEAGTETARSRGGRAPPEGGTLWSFVVGERSHCLCQSQFVFVFLMVQS